MSMTKKNIAAATTRADAMNARSARRTDVDTLTFKALGFSTLAAPPNES
jgi:hypothetical protein